MTLYCGIDLHSTNNYLGIYDQDDRVVLSKRLPNELGVVLQSLEPYKAELAGSRWNRPTTGIGWWMG